MTIKQYGGVFGRNPTFNDVTIEGQLTFDGDIDINSDLTVDGTVTAEEIIVDSGASYSSYIKTTNDSSNVTLNIWGNRSSGTGSSSPDVRLGSEQVRSAGRDVVQIRNNSTDIATFDAGGDVTISAGNLVIGTSGKGIDFSATAGTGTSELLDDYEEGVFSPVISGTTTAGTYSYSTQVGTYTKIGNSVRASISLEDITADSAGAGTLKISGLPFSADGTHISTVYARSLNFDNTAAYLIGYTDGTDIYIREIIDNSAGAGVNVADISSGNTRLYFSFFYKV